MSLAGQRCNGWRSSITSEGVISKRAMKQSHNLRMTLVESDVLQVDFQITVAGAVVPCVVWKPRKLTKPRTLIALGHGGSQHKKAAVIRERAIRYASHFEWMCLAIDAPDHGERTTPEQADLERRNTERRISGDKNAPLLSPAEKIKFLDALAAQAVPEWQAALDVTLTSLAPTVVSIGYWGVSQGTWIGVPLLAKEKRFQCAVLGLAHLHPDHHSFRDAARQIHIPLRFAFQWDDSIRSRDNGIALFNAFGSTEKSMHINPGGHTEIPAVESDSWDLFFQRHLLL